MKSLCFFILIVSLCTPFAFSAEVCVELLRHKSIDVAFENSFRLLDEGLYSQGGQPKVMKKPFLWEIKKEDSVLGYLVGTLHRYISLSHFPEWAHDIFKSVDRVFMEHSSRFGGDIDRRLKSNDGRLDETSLINRLTSAEKEKLENDLQKFNEFKTDLEKERRGGFYTPTYSLPLRFLTPYGYSQSLVENSELVTSELRRQPRQVDDQIASLAESSGARRGYLEKSGGPYLKAVADSYTFKWVRFGLLTDENIFLKVYRELLDEINAYHRGDEVFFSEDLNYMDKPQKTALLDQRNQNWVGTVAEELEVERKIALFVVGVSHMFGDSGLIKLLKDRGFSVERVVE